MELSRSYLEIMTPLLAVLDITDYVVIAVIAGVVTGFSALARRPDVNVERLERSVRDLQKKLDALLKHQGVQLPPPPEFGMSAELEKMACDRSQMIAAIKRYREENPGGGLREAKDQIEAFYKSRQ